MKAIKGLLALHSITRALEADGGWALGLMGGDLVLKRDGLMGLDGLNVADNRLEGVVLLLGKRRSLIFIEF